MPAPALPAAIETLVNEGAQVRYLGNDLGLQAWLTVKNGQEQYFYVSPDGQALVMGVLFDTKGKLITVDQVRRLQAKGDKILETLAGGPGSLNAVTNAQPSSDPATLSPSELMMVDIESSNWIPLGHANAPAVYAFIDPQCPHCKAFIQDVRKAGYLDSHQIQLRIIPVGFNAQTLAQSAYLLAAPDPAARLIAHLEGDEKALPIKNELSDQGVQRNLAVMQAWKLDATPFVIYKNKSGDVKIIRGKPQDISALLGELPAPLAVPTQAPTATPSP
jgi:hypothetical protein